MKLFIHDYAGHPFQIQLSRELASRGHKVVHGYAGGLLTPRGSLAREANDSPLLTIREVPMDPNYRRDKYRFARRRGMEIAYGKTLQDVVAEEKPDIVLSGNTPTEPQLAALLKCEAMGVSFVSWIQDFYAVAVAKLASRKIPGLGALVGAYYRHLEKKTLRRSSGIVSITDDFLPMLREYGVSAERIMVIPNWAPLDDLPLRPRRNAWSEKHGLHDSLCFLYSGTLAMKHNPDLLLQLALAFKDKPEVKVVVVSEGPGADWLTEKRTKEGLSNLILLPFQDFKEMPDVLAAGDVLLAILEPDAGVFSVPSKVLTYLCARRPILAAIPENNLAARILAENKAGLCVDPTNTAQFAAAASKFYSEPTLRQECGDRGRAYAVKHFDINKISDRFERFLKKLI